jgi:hypothetical protein
LIYFFQIRKKGLKEALREPVKGETVSRLTYVVMPAFDAP